VQDFRRAIRLDKNACSLHEWRMARAFGLFTVLLAIAMTAIFGTAQASPTCPFEGRGLASTDAFEAPSDASQHAAPLSAPDLGDDDDDDDADQELLVEPSSVVAIRSAIDAGPIAQNETIRPSPGHPPGIDDPPRS
jgi:hypothetical protein